jgi:hypothetical protein
MHRDFGFSRQSTSPLNVAIPARLRKSRRMTLASHASLISAIYSLRWRFSSARASAFGDRLTIRSIESVRLGSRRLFLSPPEIYFKFRTDLS